MEERGCLLFAALAVIKRHTAHIGQHIRAHRADIDAFHYSMVAAS